MTTQEAASRLNVTPARVRQLVGEDRLTAKKRGRDLFIRRKDVEEFAAKQVADAPKKRGAKPRVMKEVKPDS